MIFVDSSVAFKWLKSKNEPFFERATRLLEGHIRGEIRIGTLSLLFVEIANVLTTKTATKLKVVHADLLKLYGFGLEFYRETKEDVVTSALLARKHKTSVYDMLYATVAKRLGTDLITADETFVRKTKFSHVRLLSEFVT